MTRTCEHCRCHSLVTPILFLTEVRHAGGYESCKGDRTRCTRGRHCT